MTHQWLTNPATGGVWACPVPAVDHFLSEGWEPCEAPEPDESHLRDPEPPAPAPETTTTNTSKAARRGQTTA